MRHYRQVRATKHKDTQVLKYHIQINRERFTDESGHFDEVACHLFCRDVNDFLSTKSYPNLLVSLDNDVKITALSGKSRPKRYYPFLLT